MRALALARQGWKQRDIAAALDASETAVSRWLAAARRGGPETLRSHPAPGPVVKLTPEQLGLISREESSGKEDSWKLETFQMEPCG